MGLIEKKTISTNEIWYFSVTLFSIFFFYVIDLFLCISSLSKAFELLLWFQTPKHSWWPFNSFKMDEHNGYLTVIYQTVPFFHLMTNGIVWLSSTTSFCFRWVLCFLLRPTRRRSKLPSSTLFSGYAADLLNQSR